MDVYISELELVFYKTGRVNLIILDSSTFYIDSPTDDDDSVYRVKIDKKISRKCTINVYATEENITNIYSAKIDLPNKSVNDDFAAIFSESKN